MAMLSNLLVRIGVDDSRVGRAINRTEDQFGRLGRSANRFNEQMGRVGSESGRAFGDGFTRDARGRLHDGMGRFVSEGSQLGDAVGQGAIAGIKGSGPGFAVAVASLIAVLPAIGAIAATGLVLAVGAGFAALGLKAAAANKGVQKEMDSLRKHVGKTLQKISKPFVSTWNTILKTARSVFDTLAPELGKAFQHIAPALSSFVQHLGEGFKELAPSIEPLGQAFAALIKQIGPSIPAMFKGISEALTEIANTIAQNPQLFAGFITGLLKIVPLGFKLIQWLAQAFAWVSKFMGTTNALVVVLGLLATPLIIAAALFRDLKERLSAAGTSFSEIWNTAKATFASFIAFITPAITLIKNLFVTGFNFIKTVVTSVFNIIKAIIFGNFEEVKATIASAIMSIKASWLSFWNSLKAVASAAWNGLKALVRGAWNAIKSAFSSGMNAAKSIFSSGWNALKNAASSGVNRVVSIARAIPGRIRNAVGNLGRLLYGAGRNVVQGLINGIRSMVGSVGSAMSGIAGKIRSYLPFSPAKEGPLSGRGNPARSGMQIARMIAGGMLAGTGRVANAANAIAGAASVSPYGVRSTARNSANTLVINSGGSRMDDLLVEVLRSAVRNRGGNVQTVLGQ